MFPLVLLQAACAVACVASAHTSAPQASALESAPQGCSGDACPARTTEVADEESASLLQHIASKHGGSTHGEQLRAKVSKHGGSSAAFTTQPAMDNVLSAFASVQKGGTVLKYHTGANFPKGWTERYLPYAEHFQGIQRIPGSNRLVMSGSGLTEHTSQLIMVEIGSAAAAGAGALAPNADDGRTPSTDRVTTVARFDAEFDHAGGFSIWGDVLAVGAEAGCSSTDRLFGRCEAKSRVHFFDVSVPNKFTKLPYVVERQHAPAGAVALMQERDGRFLLLVGRGDSAILDFYRSSGTSLAEDPGFSFLGTWDKKSLTTSPNTNSNYDSYQTLNLVMQKDGQLFMFGLSRARKGLGSDYADLFSVSVPTAAKGKIAIVKVAGRQFYGSGVNFCAGAGMFVASPQTLMIYGVDWVPRDGVITANEFQPGCSKDTGATCSILYCSNHRGPTDCIGRKCFCKPGYCSNADGVCRPALA